MNRRLDSLLGQKTARVVPISSLRNVPIKVIALAPERAIKIVKRLWEEEGYQGPKYTPRRVEFRTSPDSELAKKLVNWGKIFHEKNLAPPYEGGSYGNMGFNDGEIRVTPSNSSLGDLIENMIMTLVDVEREGNKLPVVSFYGADGRKPTSEAEIYWHLLKMDGVRVVLHGHYNPILENFHLLSFWENVAVTTRYYPYGTPKFTYSILKALESKPKASIVIAKGHGFFSLGTTFEEAGEKSLKLAEIADKIQVPFWLNAGLKFRHNTRGSMLNLKERIM